MSSSTKITVFIVSIFVLLGIYIWIKSTIKVNYVPAYEIDDFYTIPDRRMSVNEYKNVLVSDDEMAKKYFNVFISTMINNPEKSYGLLEDDYREENFPTYGKYLAYIKNITKDFTDWPLADSYKKESDGENMIYVVKDKQGYKYVFIIEAVMKYKVKFEM